MANLSCLHVLYGFRLRSECWSPGVDVARNVGLPVLTVLKSQIWIQCSLIMQATYVPSAQASFPLLFKPDLSLGELRKTNALRCVVTKNATGLYVFRAWSAKTFQVCLGHVVWSVKSVKNTQRPSDARSPQLIFNCSQIMQATYVPSPPSHFCLKQTCHLGS